MPAASETQDAPLASVGLARVSSKSSAASRIGAAGRTLQTKGSPHEIYRLPNRSYTRNYICRHRSAASRCRRIRHCDCGVGVREGIEYQMTPTHKNFPEANYCASCGTYYVANVCHCWGEHDVPRVVTDENRHSPTSYGACAVCKKNMSVKNDGVHKRNDGRYEHSRCIGADKQRPLVKPRLLRITVG